MIIMNIFSFKSWLLQMMYCFSSRCWGFLNNYTTKEIERKNNCYVKPVFPTLSLIKSIGYRVFYSCHAGLLHLLCRYQRQNACLVLLTCRVQVSAQIPTELAETLRSCFFSPFRQVKDSILNVNMTSSCHVHPNLLFTIHQSFDAFGYILNKIPFSVRFHKKLTSQYSLLQEDKPGLLIL